jgi:hypothetical protein
MSGFTRFLTKVAYALQGAAFLAGGAATLLVNTGLLPDSLRDVVLGFSRGELETLHIIQEYGALLVLGGLLTFWFLLHYEQSRGFHWIMSVFWAIMALIHWFNVAEPSLSVVSGLINTVPFALFLAIGVMRESTEGRNLLGSTDTLTA